MDKKRIYAFIFALLFPFIMFAQEAAEEETESGAREIPNLFDAVVSAQAGDYILLPSGERYILTREEIMIAAGNFDWDNLPDIAFEISEDGTEIRTISQAHEIHTRPDGQIVHVLKSNIAYILFLNHIQERYHLMHYLDSSGILRESRIIDAPDFDVFRVFVQIETLSNGAEVPESLSVTVYNREGRNYTEKYSSVPGMVWGMVSSMELHRTAAGRTVPAVRPISELPVSTTIIPSSALREIGNRTIKVGETISLLNMTEGRNVTSWISSTPSTVTVDEAGNITGLHIGNSFITINDREYISIAVIPQESFYVVPESQSSLLPPGSRAGSFAASALSEYRTEPTFRLAFRFVNRGEHRGASGMNGGIDILGRGENYEWLWTTYYQGGWFYSLNGVMREMVDGFQRSDNGVELTIRPEFVYDDGIPYLQLRHFLHNTSNVPVTNQRFGASADVMINDNDHAPLIYTDYGAYMTDNPHNPSLELMFICLTGNGITPVDTLWLGTYGEGHLNFIYSDRRVSVHNADSAIGFSYQNINLAPGEIKEFVVRFTLARIAD